jgi:hypothetical protein
VSVGISNLTEKSQDPRTRLPWKPAGITEDTELADYLRGCDQETAAVIRAAGVQPLFKLARRLFKLGRIYTLSEGHAIASKVLQIPDTDRASASSVIHSLYSAGLITVQGVDGGWRLGLQKFRLTDPSELAPLRKKAPKRQDDVKVSVTDADGNVGMYSNVKDSQGTSPAERAEKFALAEKLRRAKAARERDETTLARLESEGYTR